MENRARGLREDQWQLVSQRWAAGESEASLAREFGIDRETIRRRRRREAWMPQATPQLGQHEAKAIHQRATAQVIDMATREAVDSVRIRTVSKIAKDVLRGLDRHDAIIEQMLDVAQLATLKILNSELARGEASQTVILSPRAQSRRAATSRDVRGKRPGDPSVEEERQDRPIRLGL